MRACFTGVSIVYNHPGTYDPRHTRDEHVYGDAAQLPTRRPRVPWGCWLPRTRGRAQTSKRAVVPYGRTGCLGSSCRLAREGRCRASSRHVWTGPLRSEAIFNRGALIPLCGTGPRSLETDLIAASVSGKRDCTLWPWEWPAALNCSGRAEIC